MEKQCSSELEIENGPELRTQKDAVGVYVGLGFRVLELSTVLWVGWSFHVICIYHIVRQ